MADCVFCDIVHGRAEAEVILEDDRFLCFCDTYPVSEGHSLVIPKRHVEQLEDVERSGMYEFLHEAHQAVRERFEPDATNVGINNGPEAGQTIAHLHWHIIPRYEDDVEDPTGGVRGVIPEKRRY